jgi:hypothetical protein
MSQIQLNPPDIVSRLEKLEQQNRKLRNGLLALLIFLLIIVGYYHGQTLEAKVIKTKKIILLDDKNEGISYITFNSMILQNDKVQGSVALSPEKIKFFQDNDTEAELSPLQLSLHGKKGMIELSPRGTKMSIQSDNK